MPASPVRIDPDGSFSLGGIDFIIDIPPSRAAVAGLFPIRKSEPFIRFYESLSDEISPEGVLELGIFQGGSYVFIDTLFEPRSMSAIDIREDPAAPLERYVETKPGRHIHYATSQTDEGTMRRIVEDELHGELDLVIDDASHRYEETKRSFEILFPLLRPGGVYVIEDWSWAHHPDYQADDARLSGTPALTNLLFEQLLLLGSTNAIAEINVRRFLYTVRKPIKPTELTTDTLWEGVLNRRRTLNRI
jgi:predicted O-methyltransferase YrrM